MSQEIAVALRTMDERGTNLDSPKPVMEPPF